MKMRSWMLPVTAAIAAFAFSPAQAAPPIKIGVIGEASSVAGASIPKGAEIAADEINAKGGVLGRKIELVTYDDHNSATDAVRAFQRLAHEDKVVFVIGSYISEVALALEPWSARLHMPFITPGAASDKISHTIYKDYDHYKYVFHGYMPSTFLADSVCDGAKDLLVKDHGVKTAVVMSEDAAWTIPLDAEYLKCLPKVGIKVLDHIRLSPDTTDFTPIFNKIEGEHPDVIITGISHVGVQPTVQWAAQHVPIPMFGISSQATTSTFWKDTNGATNGVVFQSTSAPGVATTPKTNPFTDAYVKKFGAVPSYVGYTSYDDVYLIANAIERAKSTDPDKLVTAMEHTDYVGTIGRYVFNGKDDPFTHTFKVGPGYVTGLMMQWQNGKQVPVWPASIATAKLVFPSFVKLPK